GADGWRDHGVAFPDGLTPGSREWSGTAVLGDDGRTLTMHFTAAGRRDGSHGFEQRLFDSVGRFENGCVTGWSEPNETVRADGELYRIAGPDHSREPGVNPSGNATPWSRQPSAPRL
ncbi:MAG: glycoside hydrolase family 68 protein, partial [Sphingomonas sp.]